jgi:hypothetical protein
MRIGLWLGACVALSISVAAHAAHECRAASGPGTTAFIELYTSEGCSSCPPADSALSQIKREIGERGVVIPLGMHVTYWDDLGWKDFLAQKVFDARQRELAAVRHSRLVYTPEFFVNGLEVKDWRDTLPAIIREVNARPAPIDIRLSAVSMPDGTLTLKADVAPRKSEAAGSLFLAVAEDGLVSQVSRGENGGATLRHDGAVRAWLGPFPLQQGKITLERQINVPPQWNKSHVWAVAMVEDADDHVLQAVAMKPCNASDR